MQDNTLTPERTAFDNDLSMLYKWAAYYGRPTRYMLINNETGGFTPMDERIEALADEGKNILQIYEAVTSPEVYPFPDIRLDFDVAMIYSLLFTDPQDLADLVEVFNEFFRVTNDRITGGSALPFTVQDVEALESQQQVWREQFNRYLEEDNRRYVELVEHQQALGEQQPLLRTPLVITRTTLQVKPRVVSTDSNGNRTTTAVAPNLGLEIFNESRISDYVPYLQFNQPIEEQPTDIPKNKKAKKQAEGRQLTKVFRGKTQETAPKIDNIVLPSVVTQGDNMMSMSVWMGSGDVRGATKISYTFSRYMLDTNQMFIQVPSTTGGASDLIISRIESALPLELGPTEEVRISGEFTIYELAFNRAVLLDLILNNPLFSAYLYVDEVAKPSADKNRDHIHYKSILSKATNFEPGAQRERSSVSVKLVPGTVPAGTVKIPTGNPEEELYGISDTVVNPDGTLTEVAIPEGTPFVTVKIIRAESKEVAEQFIEIFTRILSAYSQYQEPIADYYSAVLGGDFVPVILPAPQVARGRATEQYRAEALSAAAPDIFIPGYARKCQSKLQPAIATEEELQEIQAQTFIKGNIVYNRQILSFPKGNPRLYLWCPQENAPFPGVKANNLANSSEYPYVPCCFDSDQTSGRSKSAYNDYYQGTKKQTSITSTAKNKIKTAKTLQPGRVGYLPTVIEQLLVAFGIQPSETESYRGASRFGVIQGPNSFLHAVCIAVGNPQYNALQTVEEREMFVRAVRDQMAQQLYPGLLKQELYDLSDNEIIGRLQDVDLFFDPALYYRAVEELFGINVYVFVPPNARENVKEASLELPRHKLFHVRPDRPERPTVIIYKHLGAEVDVLPYPQCELVVDMQETPTMIFGPEMTQNLYQTMVQSNQLYTWELENGDILGRKDVYIQFDVPQFLVQQGYSLLQQVVDRYGKLRGVTFEKQGIQGSLLFFPSQPLNLPTTTSPVRIRYQDISPDFGEISSVSVSTLVDGTTAVTGVWYPGLGSINTLFIPIQPTTDLMNYPQGLSDPMFTEQTSFTLRLQKLKRDANVIVQLLTWLYVVSGQTPDEFIDNNILLGEDQDTAQVYDFTGLSRHLPQVNGYQQALQYTSQVTQGLVRDGRLYLSGQRLLDAIRYVLRLYDSVMADRVPPTEIKGLFVYESDFIQQSRVALFLTNRDLQLWIKSVLAERFRSFDIRDSLETAYSDQEEPYLYTSPEGNIYQVQNVFERDLQVALNVAHQWQLFRMNPGSAPEQPVQLDVSYVVFGIGTTNNLVLLEDQRIGDEPFLQILSYDGNKYAALLPLN